MGFRRSPKLPLTATLKQIVISKCSSFWKRHAYYEPGHDVPKGHFVVYVGESRSRYIIPIQHLAHPEFQILLQMAEEEYGFSHETGLAIPCNESFFQSLISTIR
ncbi:unnamed protein product [Rhodiola kirilowii]